MHLDFTLKELEILDLALQQMPYFQAAPIIASINKQLAEQQRVMDTPIAAPDAHLSAGCAG
jgi:hypothetical protein